MNVKYLWLSINTSFRLLFYIDTHVFTVSNVIGINKKKIYQTRNLLVVIDEKE